MTTRKYSSRSQQTTLTAGINSSATSATVVSGSALLGGITISAGEIFTVVIDPDTALEEIVDVTSVSTNTLTITRGIDGSTGQAHSAGAVVRHMAIGRDYREANSHIENTTTAHGLTIANVLETTDTNMITTAMLQASAVTTAKIADANVTTAKLADGSVTSAKIADLGIATGDIADAAITGAKILDGAVGTAKIDNAAVTEAKIGTAAVTTTKIADLNVTTGKIADLNITTGKIADSAITSAKIADLTIATGDIADSAITSAKIADLTIATGDIADGAITSAKILDGTIVNADVNSSAQIAYGKLTLTNSIVNADINASAAIDKTKISGTAITAADTGTVTSTMIADGTIVNGDISSSAAIALSKLATDPLARANHTGTQTASTISDFDTQVRTSKVTDLTAPISSFSMNSQKITNLATPTSSADAATKAYVDTMIPATEKGANNGVATLGSDGKLTTSQIPDVTITDTFVVSSQAAMLALTAQVGDVAVRTDLNKSFILRVAGASTLANWQELLTPTDSVLSVDGLTGAVVLSGTYATVANAANKLPLAGGTMSGAIAMGSNKITGLGTPTATGDAATKDYADTKLSLAGGTMSGAIAMGSNKITGLADATNLTDAVNLNTINNLVLAPSNLTGPITSIGAATAIASQTGTGTKFVVDQSPTIVTPTLSGNTTAGTINNTTIPSSKTLVATDSTAYVVPSQTGNAGKYLTTDGTTSSWGTVASYSAPTIGSTSIPSGATVTTIAGLTLTTPTIGNFILGYTTTATAAGTTTLTNTSNNQQIFTGTSTQTVVMPVASTMTVGTRYVIENNSTGNLTVNSSGGNLIATVLPGTSIKITNILNSGTTAASWDYEIIGFNSATGSGAVVQATSPTLATPTLTGTVTASGDINLTAAGGPGSLIDELTLILMGAL